MAQKDKFKEEFMTEHLRTVKKLQDSLLLIKRVIENVQEGLIVYDRNLRCQAWNPFMERLSGKPASEVLGRQPLELFPFLKEAGVIENLEKALRGENPPAVDFPYRLPDGRSGWVSETSVPMQNEQGEIVGVITTVQDITGRKKMEGVLRQSEERYRNIVDNIGIGVALISPDMEILSLNNQMKKWYPRIDLQNKNICYRSFNSPARQEICSYCPTFKTLQDGLVHENVTETPMDGRLINYRIVSSPIKDETGKVIAAIEMVEDITSHRQAEKLLRESERNSKMFSQRILAVREEEKKKLSVNLHDGIGTMAVAFNAGLSVIQSDLETKNFKHALQYIRRTKGVLKKEVARFRKIVEELRPPNLDVIGLAGVLKEKLFKIAQESGMDIRFNDQMGKIKLSDQVAIALYRVTQEALTNAIKHAKAKKVVVHLCCQDDQIKFSICDDGRGFDCGQVLKNSKVFKLGVQGMRERIEALGGIFIIASAAKQGTTIRISVPLSGRGLKNGNNGYYSR